MTRNHKIFLLFGLIFVFAISMVSETSSKYTTSQSYSFNISSNIEFFKSDDTSAPISYQFKNDGYYVILLKGGGGGGSSYIRYDMEPLDDPKTISSSLRIKLTDDQMNSLTTKLLTLSGYDRVEHRDGFVIIAYLGSKSDIPDFLATL